jgi:hypothetical protein
MNVCKYFYSRCLFVVKWVRPVNFIYNLTAHKRSPRYTNRSRRQPAGNNCCSIQEPTSMIVIFGEWYYIFRPLYGWENIKCRQQLTGSSLRQTKSHHFHRILNPVQISSIHTCPDIDVSCVTFHCHQITLQTYNHLHFFSTFLALSPISIKYGHSRWRSWSYIFEFIINWIRHKIPQSEQYNRYQPRFGPETHCIQNKILAVVRLQGIKSRNIFNTVRRVYLQLVQVGIVTSCHSPIKRTGWGFPRFTNKQTHEKY